MTSKPIIVVAGATGAQGGGTVTALLADPQQRFAVRALTRDPQSPAASALAARGVEVVRADFNDPATLEAAFAGAHGAFLVTNFWAHLSAAQETQEIANLASAAASAKLSHVVWSTLEDTRELLPISDPRMPVLQDAYNVPHFDAKGAGNRLFTEAGVPTTFLNTTFYYQGFISGVGPRRGEDGALALALPLESGKLLAGVDVDDIGRTAFAILAAGDTYIGQTVSLAGDHLTGAEYAEILGEVIGETVRFDAVPYDTFRTFPIPAAEEIGNMFQYYGDFEAQFTGARDLDELRRLNPDLRDFRTWATENADALKSAIG
ncbi:NmrA family NAD(P)-binding protein [Natronosporangium hydrolyticum]|uniref:NmrA family NAD(P)-binding protein n=1 Tax=Natronosporangium hydrolyticum TaxID=2811111 RepID=A0A895YPJ0_9ACTN|nr:NmrA family NAD(P)-binding protein [Natronosporangium hydrolyticum]QSB16646.1 NmrA family NAD(P)-binding protein [Natronosporangium hydrolyticum]